MSTITANVTAEEMSNIASNETNTDRDSHHSIATTTYSQDLFVLFLYVLSGIVAITGNSIVLAIIFKNHERRFASATYALIANMALSDLTAGIIIFAQFGFCSTAALECGLAMEFMCMLVKVVQIMSYFVSTYSMAAIAYDRLHVIRSPFAEPTRPNWYIAMSWIIGFTYILFCTFDTRVSEFFTPTELISCRVAFQIDSLKNTNVRTVRAVMLMVLQFFVPLGITGAMYTWLVLELHQQQIVGEPTDAKIAAKERQNRNLTIMLICTVIAFTVSWLPVHIWHLYKFFEKKLKGSKCDADFAYNLCYWFAISSCAWNPFIYCWRGTKFRQELFRMFPWCTKKQDNTEMT